MHPTAQKKVSSREFWVGAVGLSRSDLDSLKRLFSITGHRPRHYNLVAIDLDRDIDSSGIDIFVVNARDATTLIKWHKRTLQNKQSVGKKVIRLGGSHPGAGPQGYHITSPINPSKALKVFDDYTIKELNYLPEFEIGNEGAVEKKARDGLSLLSSARRENQPAEDTQALNVLVADDSLAVRKQLEIELELIHANCSLVDNGQAAVDAAVEERYDLIFLDVVMPGLDGYTACKQIKRSSLNRKTPIVLLTSKSSSIDKFKGTLAGCDTYLTKPINHNDFSHVIQKHTEK